MGAPAETKPLVRFSSSMSPPVAATSSGNRRWTPTRPTRWKGIGPGTFEFWWSRNGIYPGGFVRDAHSLYMETLAKSASSASS